MIQIPTEFLEQILAERSSDQPRRAFANWLTARNDPLGEFIRTSCEVERIPEVDWLGNEVHARQLELLNEHEAEWIKPFTDLGMKRRYWGMRTVWFRRGFVDSLVIATEGLIPDRFEQLFAAAPLLETIAVYCAVDIPVLAGSQQLSRIKRLELDEIDTEGIFALADSPNAAGLRALQFGCGIEEAGVWALAESPNLAQLVELSCCGRLKRTAWEALVEAGSEFQLKKLGIVCSEIRLDGLLLLRDSNLFASLESLAARGNDLGPKGIEALFGLPNLGPLAELDLQDNWAGPDGARNVAFSERAVNLTNLNLKANSIESDGARALAESPYLSKLQVLDISENGVESDGVAALAATERFNELRVLDLSGNEIGNAGVAELAMSHHLPKLRTLKISKTGIGSTGIRALAESQLSNQLWDLDVIGNGLGEEAIQILIDSPNLRSLKRLWLDRETSRSTKKSLMRRFGKSVELVYG